MNRETAQFGSRWLLATSLALSAMSASASAPAAPQEASVALLDERFELSRLAPGETHAELSLQVDDATVIELDANSTLAGVVTSIVGPAGQVIDEASVASLGGQFIAFEGQASDEPISSLAGQPGFHSFYRFPSLGAGTYRLILDAPSISEEAAVITSFGTDSSTVAALVAPDPLVVAGRPVVLSAIAFSGTSPVAGATVSVDVRDPEGVHSTLALSDNGVDPDDTAGDGIYSAELTPTVIGRYNATASISGALAGGGAFERQAATKFEIVPPTSALLGPFDDEGIDDDHDGFLDRVRLRPQVDTVLAGSYRAIATLRASGGKTLVRSGDATLAVGSGVIDIDFDAAGMRSLETDGPYEVLSLLLYFLDPAGAIPADHRENAGLTHGYLQSQFQRPELALTGRFTETPLDTNGNGKFDQLRIGLEVDVLQAGTYQWNAKLTTGDDFLELDFKSSSGFLSAGLNEISLVYSGLKIGQSGRNGPYAVRDLLMFGSGGRSLVANQAALTSAFSNAQFEGGHATLSCSPVKVGEPVVQPEDDSGNADFLVAQPILLAQDGVLNSLSVFVSSAAGDLQLGIYDASGPGNNPGALLATTDVFTATEGWNTAQVTSSTALSAGDYWLAFLPQSNALHTPVTREPPTFNVYFPAPFGTMPTTFPSDAVSEPGHWSVYATVTPEPELGAALVCGTVEIGQPQIMPEDDRDLSGYLVAQPALVDVESAVQTLNLYVTAAAGNLRVGIYDAGGPDGGPGAKLAETAELTVTEGWNRAPISAPLTLAPGNYWLAFHASSDAMHNVVLRSGPSYHVYVARAYGELPASFPSDPIAEAGLWSLSGTVAPLPH